MSLQHQRFPYKSIFQKTTLTFNQCPTIEWCWTIAARPKKIPASQIFILRAQASKKLHLKPRNEPKSVSLSALTKKFVSYMRSNTNERLVKTQTNTRISCIFFYFVRLYSQRASFKAKGFHIKWTKWNFSYEMFDNGWYKFSFSDFRFFE